MKAVAYYTCGSPDVLKIGELAKPAPGDRELLIKVRAASVNPLDCGELKGTPFIARLIFGLHKPTENHPARPGVDLAGQVEAIGNSVTRFKPGDEVFGLCVSNPHASGVKTWVHDQGSFGEYVCAPEATCTIKPDKITFEEAAGVPVAALTALQGLRDKGRIQAGQKVLVNGAAGGVGSFAVQIAKSYSAVVTGVCSTRNIEMVRRCGADRVVDYMQDDFTNGRELYDLIFDCVGNHSLSSYKRILNPHGICVMVGDLTGRGALGIVARLLSALALSSIGGWKFVVFLAKPSGNDLDLLSSLISAEEISPVIDRSFSLGEASEALRYLETKHARGKVVITIP